MSGPESVSALVAASRDGDELAWEQLVRRFSPLAYGIARGFRLSGADQDEVVGTMWLQLVQHLPRLHEPAALPGWISRTTRNEAVRVLRMRKRALPREDLEGLVQDNSGPGVDEALLRAEARQALREALAHLSEREQRLMRILLEDPPPSYAEISDRLGMPVGSIGPTRQRCVDKLRSSVELMALGTDRESSSGRNR